MFINSSNIKLEAVLEVVPQRYKNSPYDANKWIMRPENKKSLSKLISLYENLLIKTDSPIKSIDELIDAFAIIKNILLPKDLEFLFDTIKEIKQDKINFSIEKKASLLKILEVTNTEMKNRNLTKEWLEQKFLSSPKRTPISKLRPLMEQSKGVFFQYMKNSEGIWETIHEGNDDTKTSFKMIKNNFNDIMNTDLFDHQVVSVNFLMSRPTGNGIICSDVGTGKTLVAIAYAEQLFQENKIEHIYIICPLVMVETWKREIIKHTKQKDLSKYTILNYDKIFKEKFAYAEDSLVILDEAHILKSSSTKRFKEFKLYNFKYVVPMSATIIGNTAYELSNIYKLINKVSPIKKGSIDFKQLKEDIIRVPKSALNLPAFTIKKIPIQIDDKDEYELLEKTTIDILSAEGYHNVSTGILSEKIPAIVLTKVLRLNQYTSNKNMIMQYEYPIQQQNKFKELLRILNEEHNEQFIIWSNFTKTIEEITNTLSKESSCEFINGSVDQKVREKILDDFRDKKFRILIANPATLNAGVTLVNAKRMIYYDRDFSCVKFLQSIGRIYRIGQKHDCIVYNLFYENTIEEAIIKIIEEKEKLIKSVVESGSSTDFLLGKEVIKSLVKKEHNTINKTIQIKELEYDFKEYEEEEYDD